ncbi:hemin ABC transporter substrate-binding protein [Jannaschia pagri]|uniref:Hemin ABC transporter substrate-binding protein n=1 Tax=Jannaschia pagri TaxID=2829797 RepID=A0ABQ4NS14_9RHOB|nr:MULTISPECIES: ABC transporter substrate-binding protein [unclassified Jannaschia]GIT93199.1 hemin ABC transporter substrate-binding protein [Jannaschia sp. AI_61]GIT97034.1 hemin ABC transporter substrate-binding protein [Jannaschia sp. AI_62]
MRVHWRLRDSSTLIAGAAVAIYLLGTAAMVFAQSPAPEAARVLSIGGSVTEIVIALGQNDRLIGRDTTSTYPPEIEALPDVGYMRALSPEGVLSVVPDLIVSEDGAGPPEAIDVLQAAGIPMVTIPDGYDRAGLRAKIEAVGDALGVPDKAAALADKTLARLDTAVEGINGDPKRVLFILSTQGGRILASGTGTAADGIIRLSGATNAVAAFEGYKQMTDEAVTAADPDVILMMDRGGDHGAVDAELFAMPSLSTTQAATSGAIVRMDGLLLLGFGPRTPDAVEALAAALAEAG